MVVKWKVLLGHSLVILSFDTSNALARQQLIIEVESQMHHPAWDHHNYSLCCRGGVGQRCHGGNASHTACQVTLVTGIVIDWGWTKAAKVMQVR